MKRRYTKSRPQSSEVVRRRRSLLTCCAQNEVQRVSSGISRPQCSHLGTKAPVRLTRSDRFHSSSTSNAGDAGASPLDVLSLAGLRGEVNGKFLVSAGSVELALFTMT